jgi:dienelactone hydrolase
MTTHRSVHLFALLLIASLLSETGLRADTAKIEIVPLDTITLTESQFLLGSHNGAAARIALEFRFPPGIGKFPAIILIPGCAGAGSNVHRWAEEFNGIGYVAAIMDSLTGRGIVETCTDQGRLDNVALIYDAFRALELASKDARIDPSRIAVMGFSKGGFPALYTSVKRFQRSYGPAGVEFAAYVPFYAPCETHYLFDEEVSDRPIRMFHGENDDWLPAAPCLAYVERLRQAGKNVSITVYPGIGHAFDMDLLHNPTARPNVQVRTRCNLVERSEGVVLNVDTGNAFAWKDECVTRGATVGYDPVATSQAMAAVKAFLAGALKAPVSPASRP